VRKIPWRPVWNLAAMGTGSGVNHKKNLEEPKKIRGVEDGFPSPLLLASYLILLAALYRFLISSHSAAFCSTGQDRVASFSAIV
ncbi:MAG: hypothetical protein OSJ58_15815, partial [Dysosmobacter sp.]|nr:hypothetical protein [Dysosmobacter sp.]